MKKILLQQAAYNVWANSKTVQLLGILPGGQIHTAVKSSFPSISKTLFHIWDAEFIWLERLNGKSLTSWPSKQYGNDIPLEKMLETSNSILEWVNKADEKELESEKTYLNIKGEQFSNVTSGIILHVVNHSTFHRGQIVTMMRGLGHQDKIESTDLITFLREVK